MFSLVLCWGKSSRQSCGVSHSWVGTLLIPVLLHIQKKTHSSFWQQIWCLEPTLEPERIIEISQIITAITQKSQLLISKEVPLNNECLSCAHGSILCHTYHKERDAIPCLASHLSSFVTTTKKQSCQIINLQICACCTQRATPLQRYREQVLAPGGAADVLSQEDPGRETLPHHLGGITPMKDDCNTCSTKSFLCKPGSHCGSGYKPVACFVSCLLQFLPDNGLNT